MAASLNDHVTAEIRAELGRQHRSAANLAAELGWTPPYLSRRLIGEIALDMRDLEAIADCLQVPLSKLMPAEVAS